MLSKSETVPSYNKYDPDIWESKQRNSRYPNWQKQIKEVLTQKPEKPNRATRLGKGVIHRYLENFIYAVAEASRAGIIEKWDKKPTVWKIVIPDLEKPQEGSTYYIVQTKQGNRRRSLVFRATYGYLGTGPGWSAFIEACFEKLGLNFEIRDGDYLLGIGFYEYCKTFL